MEPYYDSDEEVCIGPLSLNEIKESLSGSRRAPSRRHTIQIINDPYDANSSHASKDSAIENNSSFDSTEEQIKTILKTDQDMEKNINSKDSSLHLDDTLEEMNRFLAEGINYSMPSDLKEIPKETYEQNIKTKVEYACIDKYQCINESMPNDTENTSKETCPNVRVTTDYLCNNNYSYQLPSQTEVNEHRVLKEIHKNKKPILKEEVTPKKKPDTRLFQTPVAFKTPKSCIPCRKNVTPSPSQNYVTPNFRDILSPISVYIHNTPSVNKLQKIKNIPVVVFKNTALPIPKELYVDLLKIDYQLSNKQQVSFEEQIKLPQCFKRKHLGLLEPWITRHVTRIFPEGKHTINTSSISTSILNTSNKDISIWTTKQAFKK